MAAFLFLPLALLLALPVNGQPVYLVEDPVRLTSRVPRETVFGVCPSNESLEEVKDELRQNISAILADLTACGAAGWRRIGYLDMTDPAQSCPPDLAFKTYSGVRVCGRATSSSGCWSTFYNTSDSQYNKVCGRIRGYQFGANDAFLYSARTGSGIDSHYVDGVSLTHGAIGNRTHIWTFTSGHSDVYDGRYRDTFCRCVTSDAPTPPAFVGTDYFCESGNNAPWIDGRRVFYQNDPVWDGQVCISSCCHSPYFTKTLPSKTTDDIEVRVCCNRSAHDSDVTIDQLELYVQ